MRTPNYPLPQEQVLKMADDFDSSRRKVESYERLKLAIETHRAQKADDRCIEDDDRLYEALGDGVKCDRHVGDKTAMLLNCARFIERRCEGGKWPSYAELEKILRQTRNALVDLLVFWGGAHDLECPEDDTCDCSHRAFNDRMQAAVDAADEALREIKGTRT
jgi:hypothetical protein